MIKERSRVNEHLQDLQFLESSSKADLFLRNGVPVKGRTVLLRVAALKISTPKVLSLVCNILRMIISVDFQAE